MKTILVVDDNPTILKMATALLSDTHQIIPARSGDQALAICARRKPDLVILDIEMPDMDGFAVLKRMREDATLGLSGIPAVFLSAQPDAAVRRRVTEAGAVDFIAKPFDKPELLARINRHLSDGA